MKNEKYMSLYDYRGSASKQTGLGKQVYAAAKAKGVYVKYEDLPSLLQSDEYTRVATYPKSFLDEYFNAPAEPESNTSTTIELQHVYERLVAIEKQFETLLKKLETPITIEEDDDLPF